NYILINRRTSFTLVPADQEIDPVIVPRIAPHDLSKHGKTEIVSTVVQLKNLLAENTAPDLKKQLGPFGRVVALKQMNQLLLQETVGNLERILATVQEGDQSAKRPSVSLEVIPLTVLDSSRVAEILKRIFPDSKNLSPYIDSDPTRNAILVKGTSEQVADVKAAIHAIGENASADTLRIFDLDRPYGPSLADAVHGLFSQMRPQSPVRVIGIPK